MRVVLTYANGDFFESDMKTLMVGFKCFDKESLLKKLDSLVTDGTLVQYQTFNKKR